MAEAVESAVALIDAQRDLFALRFKRRTGLVDILIEQGETVVNRRHQVVQLMLGRQVVVDFFVWWVLAGTDVFVYAFIGITGFARAVGWAWTCIKGIACIVFVMSVVRILQQIAGMIARGAFECG